MKAKRSLTIPMAKKVVLLGSILLVTAISVGADETTDAPGLWAASITLEQNSDYTGALGKMDVFAKVSTDSYLFEVRCGWLHYMNKEYDKAVESYQAASKIEPAALTPFLGLIYANEAAGKTSDAIDACNQVIQRDPLNYTAIKMLAAINYEKGDFLQAATNYQLLLRAHPEDTSLLSGAGWSLLKLNRKPEAVDCFQRLLILSPTYTYAADGLQAAQAK
jgi:tetratricopeptide (TPR) repeat protein